MKVSITYRDTDSLTVEEVVRQAQANYGKSVKIDINPESNMAYDHVYFGLQQLLTHEQLSILYERNNDYHSELGKLRTKILSKLEEIVDQVIIDNESKVA